MSRSGYSYDGCDDDLAMGRWRGIVLSATRGKRGHRFFVDLVAALDAMPVKELIAEELEKDGQVCTIGSLGKARGVDMSKLDPEEPEGIGATFNIATCLVQEVEYMNDEMWDRVTPEERWQRMRDWAAEQIAKPVEA